MTGRELKRAKFLLGALIGHENVTLDSIRFADGSFGPPGEPDAQNANVSLSNIQEAKWLIGQIDAELREKRKGRKQ